MNLGGTIENAPLTSTIRSHSEGRGRSGGGEKRMVWWKAFKFLTALQSPFAFISFFESVQKPALNMKASCVLFLFFSVTTSS